MGDDQEQAQGNAAQNDPHEVIEFGSFGDEPLAEEDRWMEHFTSDGFDGFDPSPAREPGTPDPTRGKWNSSDPFATGLWAEAAERAAERDAICGDRPPQTQDEQAPAGGTRSLDDAFMQTGGKTDALAQKATEAPKATPKRDTPSIGGR